MTPAEAIQAHLGLTGIDTAARLGEHPNAWRRWVRGDVAPTTSKVEAWCEALGLTLEVDGDGWRVAGSPNAGKPPPHP